MRSATEIVAPSTLLTLGRVSNLPTVWTNVLAGTALADTTLSPTWRIAVPLTAMSLLYVGGMYLNDFFDRAVDARERPQRPIPAGSISAVTVCVLGFAMLCAGVALLATAGVTAGLAGALLALLIVVYDAFHKENPFAPVIMGLCRAFVYGGAAATVAAAAGAQNVMLAALALTCFVAGLTYAARQESLDRIGNLWPLVLLFAPMMVGLPALWHGTLAALIYATLLACALYAIYLLAMRPVSGAVSRAVSFLIAGISLVDAALLASVGAIVPALIATLGFPATLTLQRYIPGT